MENSQQGLRHRLRRIARQIDDQHRHLQDYQDALRAATAANSADAASTACARYQSALIAHFDLEESFFFPALHGYAPSQETTLVELEQAHVALLQELAQLTERISTRADGVEEALERFLGHLRSHEHIEVDLWQRIQ